MKFGQFIEYNVRKKRKALYEVKVSHQKLKLDVFW